MDYCTESLLTVSIYGVFFSDFAADKEHFMFVPTGKLTMPLQGT